jgi:hypothetical protein
MSTVAGPAATVDDVAVDAPAAPPAAVVVVEPPAAVVVEPPAAVVVVAPPAAVVVVEPPALAPDEARVGAVVAGDEAGGSL